MRGADQGDFGGGQVVGGLPTVFDQRYRLERFGRGAQEGYGLGVPIPGDQGAMGIYDCDGTKMNGLYDLTASEFEKRM